MSFRMRVALAIALILLAPTVVSAQESKPVSTGGGNSVPPPSTTPPAPTTPPTMPSTSPTAGSLTPEGAPVVAENYRLDTGDTISIKVARHPDVTGTALIPADGIIDVARLKEPVQARGKTCKELAEAFRLGLSHELKLRPGQITVTVTIPRVRRVYVRGNATKGGDFDLKNDWRVTELVAVVGGVPQADRVRAKIFNPRRQAAITVNLVAALDSPEDSSKNILLMEGDTLTVDLPNKKRIFVEGELENRGMHEVDERFGLRRALSQLGFTTANATGALRSSKIVRSLTPGDPNGEKQYIKVDLVELVQNESLPDIPLQDLDTLMVPRSERWVYVLGEVTGGPRQWFMPEDRKTFLLDVMTTSGFTTVNAKIGAIQIARLVDPSNPNGERKMTTYDYGKYLSKGDSKNNPEILPKDIIYIPNVKRPDVNSAWTIFGLRNLVKTFLPFVP